VLRLPSVIVDTYLRKFKSSDASGRTFYTNNVFDSVKYARTNQIFHKGILFNVKKRLQCRLQTEASRSEEPYWEASGGALRITRIVPSTEEDLVYKLGYSMRITNQGELEFTA
jgi:hypothetical protein